MAQTQAILRYVGKLVKGTNDQTLYPGNDDALLMHSIDCLNVYNDDFMPKYMPFALPVHPEYKNKDEHFLNFITKHLPEWMSHIEGILNKSSGKYLFGDRFTTADCTTGAVFIKLVWNDHYEHNLIL